MGLSTKYRCSSCASVAILDTATATITIPRVAQLLVLKRAASSAGDAWVSFTSAVAAADTATKFSISAGDPPLSLPSGGDATVYVHAEGGAVSLEYMVFTAV